ncbi:MAG TPA: type II secretion system protein [Thermoguttaceae bacterium]|nr:type II secretion system protein [Thermoguttaceae bacterium]
MRRKSSLRFLRRGFSFLELQVALILLGIAMTGLVPLVVMQSRQLKRLEARLDHGTTYYLVPSTSVWARKLGAPAKILTEPETVVTPASLGDEYKVEVLSLVKPWTTDTAKAVVQLTEIPEEEGEGEGGGP